MNFPGNDHAFNPGGASVQPKTDRQTRVESPSSHSANSRSSNVPALGPPSRLHSATDTSPFSFIALPTEILCHTLGFLDSMEIVLLSRASKMLYAIGGAMQRSVPADHWRGGSTSRTIEQRELTYNAFCWRQKYLENQRSEAVQAVVPFAPGALQKLHAIESQARIDTIAQASSMGSRFRHVSFLMNDGPLVFEIGEALSKAVGWQHLELIVSNVKPLAGFLLQLAANQSANRAASPANVQQPDRELSICLQNSRSPFPEAEIPHIEHVLRALQAEDCGLRVVSLELPQKYEFKFIDFIGENPHIQQIVASLDTDATPLLEALRPSRPVMRSLSLSFRQADSEPPALESLFSQSDEWQLDFLSLCASSMAASIFPLEFLASCKIRELKLVGLKFGPEPTGADAFGAALATNTAIEKIEFGYCDFPSGRRDIMSLLTRLSASTSLRCLTLRQNVGRGSPMVSRQIADCIKGWTSLSEVHFDQTFFKKNKEAINDLQSARPFLKIFIDEKFFEFSGAVLLSNWHKSDSDDKTEASSDDWSSRDYSDDSSDDNAAESNEAPDGSGAGSSAENDTRNRDSHAGAMSSMVDVHSVGVIETGNDDLVYHEHSTDSGEYIDSPREEGSDHDQALQRALGEHQQDFLADIDQVIERARNAEKQ